ncbi:hypothetical protein BJ741DRAFT_626843 [Chytriomyces cf. hyalinus JEL632]|nr:hypothetical protein BJ741DRAFT_626843 [Chytriomyces cf. hyalinus JEL632]
MRGHADRVAQSSGGTQVCIYTSASRETADWITRTKQEQSKGYRPGCKVSAAPPPVRSILPEFTFAAVEYPEDEWGAAEDAGEEEKLEDQVQPTTSPTPKYSILKRQDQLSNVTMQPPVSRIRNPLQTTETATTAEPTEQLPKAYRNGSAAPSRIRSIKSQFSIAAAEFFPTGEWGAEGVSPQQTDATPPWETQPDFHEKIMESVECETSQKKNRKNWQKDTASFASTDSFASTTLSYSRHSAVSSSSSSYYQENGSKKSKKYTHAPPPQYPAPQPWRNSSAESASFSAQRRQSSSTTSVQSSNASVCDDTITLKPVAKTPTQSIATQTYQTFLCASCANCASYTKTAVAIKTELNMARISVDLSEEEWGLEEGQYEHEDIASMDTQRDDCALLEKINHTFPAEAATLTLNINENDIAAENEPEFRNQVEDSDDEQQDWTPRAFSQRKLAKQAASTALKPWLIDPESEDEVKTLEDIQVDIKSNAQARRQETRKKKLMQTQRSPPGSRPEPQLFKFDEQSAYRYTPDDEKNVQPCFTVPSVQLPSDEWNEQESQSFDYEQSTYPYAQADSEQGFNFKNAANNKKSNSGKRGNAQGRGKRGAKTGVISFEELSARALELSRLAYERNSEKVKLVEEVEWRG